MHHSIKMFLIFQARLKRDLEEARPALLDMQHAERMVQLAGMVEVAISAIEPHMAPAWFRKLQSYIPACIGKEDILM